MSGTDTEETQPGRAGRAVAALTLVALGVAVAVLIIDQQIKREIIAQALHARRLLDEARELAEGVSSGQRPDHQGAADSGGGNHRDPVDGSATLAAETGDDDSGSDGVAGRRKAAPRSRPGRDGN